eukprot:SAG22_NODE_1041_length_5885_cov_9.278776_1_plen_205_part_00
MEDSLNASRLLSCVNNELKPHRDSVQDKCGPEVTELLFKHLTLMAEYEDQLQTCGGNPKDKRMIDMTLRLQDSVRTISRLPKKYPGIVENLMGLALQLDMPLMSKRFVHTMEGLKQLTRQRLMTTVEEDSSRSAAPPVAPPSGAPGVPSPAALPPVLPACLPVCLPLLFGAAALGVRVRARRGLGAPCCGHGHGHALRFCAFRA